MNVLKFKEFLNEVYLKEIEPSTDTQLIRDYLLDLKNFKLRHSNDCFIIVNVKNLLHIHAETDPEFVVDRNMSLGGRIQGYIDFVSRIVNLPKQDKKDWLLEAPLIDLKGKDGISYSDGRHRTKAMEELGCLEIVVEVSKKEKQAIEKLLK